MRKLILALVPALLLTLTPVAGQAGTVYGASRQTVSEMPHKWFTKLGSGCLNIVFSPFEIPFNSMNEALNSDLNPVAGLFSGAIVGVGFMLVRVATGIAEVVTFPVRFSQEPFMEPETPLGLTYGRD